MNIVAILEKIYSKRDSNGNVYWSFRFTDCATNRYVHGIISGGEGNLNGIRRHWPNANMDDWNDGIYSHCTEMSIREFNRLTKDWPYAGCRSEDIAEFIRTRNKG